MGEKWKYLIFLCFRFDALRKRELILVLFVRLFGLCLFRFVGFLFLLGSGKGCGLWLWHSLDFSLTFFGKKKKREGERENFCELSLLIYWINLVERKRQFLRLLFALLLDTLGRETISETRVRFRTGYTWLRKTTSVTPVRFPTG